MQNHMVGFQLSAVHLRLVRAYFVIFHTIYDVRDVIKAQKILVCISCEIKNEILFIDLYVCGILILG